MHASKGISKSSDKRKTVESGEWVVSRVIIQCDLNGDFNMVQT